MTLWLREILGWLLLGIGLAVFLLVYQSLSARRIIDCIPLTFIGFVIFRGGMHLIKVATAARLARSPSLPASASKTMPMVALSRKYEPPINSTVPGQDARL
jgi:hypothetical protein